MGKAIVSQKDKEEREKEQMKKIHKHLKRQNYAYSRFNNHIYFMLVYCHHRMDKLLEKNVCH